jgi:hypothetical protein
MLAGWSWSEQDNMLSFRKTYRIVANFRFRPEAVIAAREVTTPALRPKRQKP